MRPPDADLPEGKRKRSSQRLGRLSCSMKSLFPSERMITAPFSKKNDKPEGTRFFFIKQSLFWEMIASGDAVRIHASGFAMAEP